MIYLITGAIGTGKTTWVTDQLMQINEKNEEFKKKGELDKVRQIYSNIDGLKVPHLEIPDDWRQTPNNSVIAWDECHKIQIFQPNRKQLHDDERIIALNESRHTGHDLYFITQAPKFLHQHVRGLCNIHYHFHNPMGLGASTVFMWRHGNTTTPDSQQAKNLAENSFVYQFKKSVQENFSSIEEDAQHTRKVKVPKKIIFVLTALVAMLGFIGYLLMKPSTTGNLTGETFMNAGNDVKKGQDALNGMNNLGQANTSASDLSVECRKGSNVEKPECKKWFDDLTKNKGSVNEDGKQTVTYNVSDPYVSSDEIQKQLSYQVTSKPVFSGCMQKNGQYVAFTQQGTIIHGMSQANCKRLIQDADRPFNYFANDNNQDPNRQQDQQQQQNFIQNPNAQMSAEDIAKYQEAKRQGLI
jgi:zona occludens toxin